ncbi:MAG: GNAT family N-acetyltransferase [Defluviitaleaceae bacterium]|nr:GNAT family N-acetyltransferase [Defluviitaleaceae bacterium]MCL2835901.1 GNAT family N-acetyltransferase [Defluviitaleaceae bacterium]
MIKRALDFLESNGVLDKYTRRGFALELLGYIVNVLLCKREVPYSQIEFNNEASVGLHKKLGFEISADKLYRLIN